jgi:hypothetical protein
VPLTEEEHATTLKSSNTPDTPFYIDSGATSHCSPVRANFIDLVPIKARDVKGMSGTCISAIGRGTIKLKCSKGNNLVLRDVLYIPQATLRLISVRRLADEDLRSAFNKTKFLIRNSSGKTITSRMRKGRELYSFDGAPMIIEHMHIARAIPNLETWHKQLGHINYAPIISMAKNRLTSGMHIDLSALPHTCEHCVVSK